MAIQSLMKRIPLSLPFLRLNIPVSRRIDFFKYVHPFSTKTQSPDALLGSVTPQKVCDQKKPMSFEQFKETQMESLEEYKKSPIVKELMGDDMTKISSAYEGYCRSKYALYRQLIYGGNPATMI